MLRDSHYLLNNHKTFFKNGQNMEKKDFPYKNATVIIIVDIIYQLVA